MDSGTTGPSNVRSKIRRPPFRAASDPELVATVADAMGQRDAAADVVLPPAGFDVRGDEDAQRLGVGRLPGAGGEVSLQRILVRSQCFVRKMNRDLGGEVPGRRRHQLACGDRRPTRIDIPGPFLHARHAGAPGARVRTQGSQKHVVCVRAQGSRTRPRRVRCAHGPYATHPIGAHRGDQAGVLRPRCPRSTGWGGPR